MKRTLLGRDHDIGTRRKVFEIEDGLEVEELSIGQIERRRVYFDDVLLLTYHRYRGGGFLFFTGASTALLVLIAFSLARERGTEIWSVFFAVVALVFAASFLFRVIFGVDVVTVWGRRTSARVRFPLDKARALLLFTSLREKIEAVQERLREEEAGREGPREADALVTENDLVPGGTAPEPEPAADQVPEAAEAEPEPESA